MTRNPNKCTPYLRAISTKIEIISTTRRGRSENSSVLSSGRRPVSKSVEFSDLPLVVVEILGRHLGTFPKRGAHIWIFSLRVRLSCVEFSSTVHSRIDIGLG